MSFLNDKMVSRGVMYYDNHSRLRWEYTSPYKYIFILSNNKVYIKSVRKTNTIDIKSSRLFQSIARIMMNSVTGRSLTDNGDFTVKMYVNGDEWVAFLTPKRSDMKKMFKSIHLYFDSSRSMVSKVEMLEKNGDSTVILLHGVKTNTGINEKVFSAN
jgi:outer membrane lipoprotein carrier protein